MHSIQWKALPLKGLIISLGLAALDQFTKALAIQYLHFEDTIYCLSYIVLHLCYNPGMAFGWLGHHKMMLFFLVAVSLFTLLKQYYKYYQTDNSTLLLLGFSFILGGALGNLYDRITIGAVIDFIGIYIPGWKTSIFNLADLFISVGTLFVMIHHSLTGYHKQSA